MAQPMTMEQMLTGKGFVISPDGTAARPTATVPAMPAMVFPLASSKYHHTRQRRQWEEEEQIALLRWVDEVAVRSEPLLGLLYHIPNGKYRTKAGAGRLKAMGVRAGYPDLHLPVGRRGYLGMWLELKTPGRQVDAHQRAMHALLTHQGHCVGTYQGWIAAATALCWYMDRADLAEQLEVVRMEK